MHENCISNQNHKVYGSSLFCDSSTFRFVDISPSAPMIISGAITLVTVFQFISILLNSCSSQLIFLMLKGKLYLSIGL
ncbi:hypothetical protein T07_10624 [Trichinella nelsoni]|uniref:Uncharacterized protein n=1 Tax=Trichinella nelsoni TaxID=6336 RepID=A0A0V0REM3_9BILA|nr:hypothetical protein T07_10624 [Trichinella nelsoni]